MFKSKIKLIVITFILFAISLVFINNNYASYMAVRKNNEVTDWKVAITSDTKDLEDTQKIDFKVENNSNVAKGKIAPGLKAIASVNIDLIGTQGPVDIYATIDDTSLKDTFRLTTKLEGESYTSGEIRTIEIDNKSVFTKENGNKILILELEWLDNDNENDTILGMNGETITVPVTIRVSQHI